MRVALQRYLERVWYQRKGGVWLRPLGAAYAALMRARRRGYQSGFFKSHALPVPVVVVGNLTVGGTGKTPLTLLLAERFLSVGLRPGIISRGYGGRGGRDPLDVNADSDPAIVGDEPLLFARRLNVPVSVCKTRIRAAQRVVERGANVVIADDGLQHLALRRDVQIIVIDAQRGLGNGRCLPAGPLRESPASVTGIDATIIHAGRDSRANPSAAMHLRAGPVVPLDGDSSETLAQWQGRRVHAVAAIGNPARFFAMLRSAGLDVIEHAHLDHAQLRRSDFEFGDGLPILMTEKDAVKCRDMTIPNAWYLPVTAMLNEAGDTAIVAVLEKIAWLRND